MFDIAVFPYDISLGILNALNSFNADKILFMHTISSQMNLQNNFNTFHCKPSVLCLCYSLNMAQDFDKNLEIQIFKMENVLNFIKF